jgi:hypothetical protein
MQLIHLMIEVMLPLSLPQIGTLIILTTVTTWNNFLWPGVAITKSNLQPLAVAKLLRAVVGNELPQLVICGKQAIDDDANQTGQMLAALLDWPQAAFASKVDIAGGVATAFDYAMQATMKRADAIGHSANRVVLLRDANRDGVAEVILQSQRMRQADPTESDWLGGESNAPNKT